MREYFGEKSKITEDYADKMADQWLAKMKDRSWLAINDGNLAHTDFICICVQVDSVWKSLADGLYPNSEKVWQGIRDRGFDPTFIRIAEWSMLCSHLSKIFPQQEESILQKPHGDKVKCLLLFHDNMALTYVTPKRMDSDDVRPKLLN